MNDHRPVLKRIGLVLVVVGVLDIAYMIYCVSQGQSYSSSFNIFSVIAGIFLLRGNLKAVRFITWFSAFALTGFAGALLLFPFQKPLDLWATELRLHPVGTSASVLFGVAAVALLAWVYTQLRTPIVVEARMAAGQKAAPPKLAFALGASLVLGLAIMVPLTLGGESGVKAIEVAKAKHGASYQYQVTGLHWAGEHIYATLTAYNEHEIKSVQVEWQE